MKGIKRYKLTAIKYINYLNVMYTLEEEMATHCSILAWRIPWTDEPGGLQYMESKKRTQLSN